jgi:hypothetical protein
MDTAYLDPLDHTKRPYRAERNGRKLRTKDGRVRKFGSLKAAKKALRRSQP